MMTMIYYITMFVWLTSHQPAVLFPRNKPAINNQPAVLFSQNKPASAISHLPNEQTEGTSVLKKEKQSKRCLKKMSRIRQRLH
jgi:hypothetical protein